MRGILRVKGCAQTLLRCRLAGGHSHWWNHQGTPLSSSGSPVWPRFTRQSSLLLRGLPAPGPGGQEAWRPSSRWVSPSSWGRVRPQTLVALLVAQEESSGERPACRQGTGGADAGCQGGCGPVLRQPGPRSAARVSADVGTRFRSSTAGRRLERCRVACCVAPSHASPRCQELSSVQTGDEKTEGRPVGQWPGRRDPGWRIEAPVPRHTLPELQKGRG